MDSQTIVVGLDVHKQTIVAAVLPSGAERVRERLTIENQPRAIEQMVRRLAAQGPLEFVYEAGPCGYDVHRQLRALGWPCAVIAPALTPVRPGDRVKTDRRDAEKLARFYRAGELRVIHVPTREGEAARDLVRTREDLLGDRSQACHRLTMFLLRQGRVYRETRSWGVAHRAWLRTQHFPWAPLEQTFQAYLRSVDEIEAHLRTVDQHILDLVEREPYRTAVQYFRCLKGVETLSAITFVVEVQEFRRFLSPRAFMSYTGLVPSEASSGGQVRRGHITKAGNAHLRRILVEAAWSYRHANRLTRRVLERRLGCPPTIIAIAQEAQDRLHRKFWRLVHRNKRPQVAVTAVARELAGFVWAIAQCLPVEV